MLLHHKEEVFQWIEERIQLAESEEEEEEEAENGTPHPKMAAPVG